MNKIVKNALILAAITLIAGLLLGAAHQVTLEPIQKQQEKEKQESCQNVFPEAVSFEEVTMSDAEQAELTAALIGHGFEAQTIDELLLAKDASGATIGLVEIISTTEGYGGGMQFSMGIASDGTTKGISFLSLSETAGLGMRADTDDLSACVAAARAHVDHVIGITDKVEVVFDHDNRGALGNEAVKHTQQHLNIERM